MPCQPKKSGTCCGAESSRCAPPSSHWISGTIDTATGAIPRVRCEWTGADYRGALWSRVSNRFRMNYAISPGLYAAGDPDQTSPVLVTANYKFSFDLLRRAISGRSAWILVLDTKGINVWCAAGKETFGTRELLERMISVRLDQVVSHRRIVVPQLGAPGIAAHVIRDTTGFTVLYGPVRASDLPAYLDNGCAASRAMRTVTFTMRDRLALTPMELTPATKRAWIPALVLLAIFGAYPEGILFRRALVEGGATVAVGIGAILAGGFLTPLLLPVIPFRSFALKGLTLAMLIAACAYRGVIGWFPHPLLGIIMLFVFFPALTSYVAVNFTGATPFTGMSGVRKELRIALPLYIGAAAASILSVLVYKVFVWGMI